MSMSRDGLLPKRFSRIHPKYKTPSYATVVTGFVVAIPALFLNLTMVTDLCSIGTLFAFVLVCAGVLVLQNKTDIPRGKFKTPYVNSKYVIPLCWLRVYIMPSILIIKGQWIFLLTKLRSIQLLPLSSLNKEESKKYMITRCGSSKQLMRL
jgi:amino acid transporter